ncbi:sulfite exporter TauE/SafE family protein [Pseudogemmobacter bohemicus]|uniref:sulfite exporter TauE/SafE family protein n=1 Tax=Pseudogemmobacter bohemicus TaxID=2250708 RepID=UPI000DD3C2A5|nr:sulfite exporter TauE/SafE family protein [Pseudogemmobacter bohemicus]
MEEMGFWLLAVVAAALVGLSKGGLPAVGMLAVPVMALQISPVVAAGILLPVYVVSDMFGLWAYRHAFDRKVLQYLLPGAVAGIAIGGLTASVVPEAAVTLLIGVIGLAFSLSLLLRRPLKGPPCEAKPGPGAFWGLITGFTSFVSHSGAPPYQVYTLPLRLEKAVFAGTSTIAFAVINAVKLIPYGLLGQLNPGNLKLSALLMAPAVASVFAGVWLVKVLPAKAFFRLVTWSLLLISLKLVRDGLRGIV